MSYHSFSKLINEQDLGRSEKSKKASGLPIQMLIIPSFYQDCVFSSCKSCAF